MHGGRSQAQRNRALADFSEGSVDALVATDVAARGLHVDDVATVVHYDPPNGHKDYLHRSGRTARAGASGRVVSLVLRPERRAVNRIKRQLELDLPTVSPTHRVDSNATRTRDPHDRAGERRTRSAREPAHTQPEREASTIPPGHVELFVGNLAWEVNDRDLAKLFRRHGAVSTATVKLDRRGRSKGVGIVTMHRSGADSAIDALAGRKVRGRALEVRRAR